MPARLHPGGVVHVWDHFVVTLRSTDGDSTLSLYAITWSPAVGSGHVAIFTIAGSGTSVFQDTPGTGARMQSRLAGIGTTPGVVEAPLVDARIERLPADIDGLGFRITAADAVVEARLIHPNPPTWVEGPAPAFWDQEDIWAVMIDADEASITVDGVPLPGVPFRDDQWVPKLGRSLSSAHVALAEVRVTPEARMG